MAAVAVPPMKRARANGPVVWWARNDLRLEDNPVLRTAIGEAFTDARKCAHVFVFDPRFLDKSNYGRVTDPNFEKSIKTRRPIDWGNRKCNALRARFWLQCVRALGRGLAAHGCQLIVCHGRPEEVLAALPAGCTVVCQQEPVSPEQTDVEDAVERALAQRGGVLRREWGAMSLYQRGDLPFRIQDQMPGSYSGLGAIMGWKDIWTSTERHEWAPPVRECVPAPAAYPEAPAGLEALPGVMPKEMLEDERAALKRLGYSDSEIAEAMAQEIPEGGENAVRAHFAKWIEEKGDSGDTAPMAASWDLPVSETATTDGHDPLQWANLSRPDGWTRVSHYMALGCISAREMYNSTQGRKNHPGVVHRLMWREWHRLNAIHWGRRLYWLQGPGRIERPWSKDPELVEAWKLGKTGIPYIDACMRELRTTGWLAYKGRKTAGHFLVFDLGIDWRIGAFHYEEVLLDYDVAMNYGNWVTVARVDKPRSWGEPEEGNVVDHADIESKLGAEQKNDPTGAYIRRWVPELKDLDDAFIHKPWEMSDEDMQRCKCILGKDYPVALVQGLKLVTECTDDGHPGLAAASEAVAKPEAAA